MEAQEEKINHVQNLSDQLYNNNHYAMEKIKVKADSIEERRVTNRQHSDYILAKLKDLLRLKQFLEDADEVCRYVFL